MIRRIPDLPDNVIGLSATGTVKGDDYENVVIPAMEAAFAAHEKARLLYYLGPEFESFTGAAMWDDAKIGMQHISHMERVAIVTDKDWMRNMAKVLGFAWSGEVRVFSNDELADAKAWIVA